MPKKPQSPPLNYHDSSQKVSLILLSLGNRMVLAEHLDEIDSILQKLLPQLCEDAFYTLCLLNQERNTYRILLSNTTSNSSDNPTVIIASQDSVFFSQQVEVFNTKLLVKKEQTPWYAQQWLRLGLIETLAIPLYDGRKTNGVVFVHSQQQGQFSAYLIDILSGVARLVGLGIQKLLAQKQVQELQGEIKTPTIAPAPKPIATPMANHIIGKSLALQEVLQLVTQVASSVSTVLLLGETGTGKELIAKAIHEASPRKSRNMVKLNCAAIPAHLLESELFGHEKGSFTGATDQRIGKFELAQNSTLFLDEIGELPLELQLKLLRVLQEKEMERIGGRQTIKLDVRIIAATSRHLEEEIGAGRFRADLYYRLNIFPIMIPPLRKRKEDIPLLVNYFIEKYAQISHKNITGISAKALEELLVHPWLGNIRELEHLIERSVLLSNSPIINKVDLPTIPQNRAFEIKTLATIEREHIVQVLQWCNGRIFGANGAAIRLDLPATTLISKMKKLGIKKEHFLDTP
ncbi:sigma 54-interacting transcriptional regulator [Flectobacillus major]|uniref:sigma 54-interacting transcriptional regulator n=1 Tax=Flectobacillus major TaxID=103 RepID=UPI0005C745BE|nr:sigma 54-interacting transcriptional regulator [Flectobacillus major]